MDLKVNIVSLTFYMIWLHVDIAIGAPFGEGSGNVYIYYGSATDVLSNEPVQVQRSCDYHMTITWHTGY